MEIWSVVLAGGHGTRYGAAKQFAEVGGRRLVDLAVDVVSDVSDGVVVVLPAGGHAPPDVVRADAGPTRAASVRAGLAAVPEAADVVVVHDAAHPAAPRSLLQRLLEALEPGVDGVVPGLASAEALARDEGGDLGASIAKAGIVQIQMPQVFRAAALRSAHADAPDAVEDGGLVRDRGGRVLVVAGDPANIHVTTAADLEVVRRLLGQPARPPDSRLT